MALPASLNTLIGEANANSTYGLADFVVETRDAEAASLTVFAPKVRMLLKTRVWSMPKDAAS